jgi:hypothetical protein
MTPNPATNVPNTAWLDEELRRQKAQVAELRGLVDKQQVLLTDQAQRLLALEDRLAKLQAQLVRIPEVEEALRHTRDEVALQLAEARQEQQKAAAEFLRNRRAEREQDVRAIQEITVALQRLDPLEQGLAVRQAEERRLNEAILRVQESVESLAKRMAQREEAQRQLADRLEQQTVKGGQLELGLAEAQKAQQEFLARLLVAETSLAKLTQQMAEMQTLRQDLTRQQAEFQESLRRADLERTQTLTDWGRKLEEYSHQMEVWSGQLRYYSDQHEKNRRLLREIQELSQQVSQQQDQLRQLQRIAEEQLRRELREWRSENDLRWAQELERRQKWSKEQAEREDAQEQRLSVLEQGREEDRKAALAQEERNLQAHAALAAKLDETRLAHVRTLKAQAKTLHDLLAELRGLFGEEK